jgi:hypothetical protein
MLPVLLYFVVHGGPTLIEGIIAACTAFGALVGAYVEHRRVAWDQSDIRERLVKCEARLDAWDASK